MEIPGRVTIEPGKMGGQPCIRGHRFTVEHLLSLVGAGWTLEQIQDDFTFIEAADVQQAIAYAAFSMREITCLLLGSQAGAALLREQCQSPDMSRANYSKISPVQGSDSSHVQPLGDGDHDRVHSAEGKAGVRFDEFGHSLGILNAERSEFELMSAERSQEHGFSLAAALAFQQVANFSDIRLRYQPWAAYGLEHRYAAIMVMVISVGGPRRPGG